MEVVIPKLKNYGKGRRFNLWVPERLLPTYLEIENRSKFLQIALEQAVGIMAFAILKQREPQTYDVDTRRFEDYIEEFNDTFPLDPMTKKRMEHERAERVNPADSPQPHSELW